MTSPRYLTPMLAILFLATAYAPACLSQERPTAGEFFKRLDVDNNGKLTREELPERIRGNFDRVDTDNDGFISPKENAAVMNRQRQPQRQPQRRSSSAERGSQIPDAIRAEMDIPYAGTANPRQKLDLLLPKQRVDEKPLPVIVWIHGGAWRAGDKRSGLGNLAKYVASGRYAGVSVAYRLTGEAIWPTQIHDCKAAIRWIRAHAQKYNLDDKKIAVWGSSAGGHLVALLGTSGGVTELEGTLGDFADQESRVTCVVDYFGPSELAAMGKYPSRMDHDAADSPESKLVGGPVQEMKKAARSASATTYVTKDDPPFLIVHGDEDPLVPHNQSVRLHDLLKQSGCDATLITITGGGHGGFNSEELDRRVEQFLDKHLRGKAAVISPEPIPRAERAQRQSVSAPSRE